MSPADTARLLAVVAAAYPGFEVNETRHAVWTEMLDDLDYPLANTALRRHISVSRFAPTVADIREQAAEQLRGEGFTGAESWGEFIGAIRRYGWNREAEALDTLHPATQRVARLLGWHDSNMSENVDVLRGQFLRMFDQLKHRDEREAVLPQVDEISQARVIEIGAGIGKVMS